MTENNGSQAQSQGQDFNGAVAQAQQTGDFDYVLKTAKESKDMLVNFRDAVAGASFPGKEAAHVAMGLNFLNGMIQNATNQLAMLKQTAKATMDAIKATSDTQAPPQDAGV